DDVAGEDGPRLLEVARPFTGAGDFRVGAEVDGALDRPAIVDDVVAPPHRDLTGDRPVVDETIVTVAEGERAGQRAGRRIGQHRRAVVEAEGGGVGAAAAGHDPFAFRTGRIGAVGKRRRGE